MERATHLSSSLLLGRLTSCSVPHGRQRLSKRTTMKRRTQLQVFVLQVLAKLNVKNSVCWETN